LVGLGFGLRASSLQSRCSTTWVHFVLVIVEMGGGSLELSCFSMPVLFRASIQILQALLHMQ
jgi:hypothetical protein